jgi:ubiquinone biosynthesis protein
MVDWGLLIDDNALASVLAGEYDHFATPVREALIVFLEGLPEEHQAAILAQQAALPRTASFSQRLARLARSCPVLHKLAQVLARDRRLAPELRQGFQQLESLPSSISDETIWGILTRELGSLDRLGITLVPPAIAEASVAVVIGFQQTGVEKAPDGVFKILKPGIEERLERELELTERVGAHLDQRCDELRIPHLDYEESFEQVRERLQGEVRLDQEQCHLERARAFYADEPRVQVPSLFDFCTARVTAMQRVTGDKVTNHSLDSLTAKRRLAELVIDALIARPIFSKDNRALFHCDPHAGNLFLTKDRRLAVLDWSLVGTLGEKERIAIAHIMLGAMSLDTAQIARVLAELAERPPDQPALFSAIEAWLRRIRQGQLPGLRWLLGMLDEAVQTAGLRVGADLMVFRKTLHTLSGVLLDLEAGGSQIDGVLLTEFLRHFAVEWPWRWVTPLNSREFTGRLSSADLSRWMLALPATATRFWEGHFRDMLSAHQQTTNASRPYT